MPLTLVVEDGSGNPLANSFSSVADCELYHAQRLYSTAWTGASVDNKPISLAHATSVICAQFEFDGSRASEDQALCWPRIYCPNRDVNASIVFPSGWASYGYSGTYWPSDVVPALIKAATCELARLLLESDRTAEDDSKGIKRVGLGRGAVDVEFDASDRKKVFTETLLNMLSSFGQARGSSGFKRVVRT